MNKRLYWWGLCSGETLHLITQHTLGLLWTPCPPLHIWLLDFLKGTLSLLHCPCVFFFQSTSLVIVYLSVAESSWSWLLVEDGNKLAVSVMIKMRLKRHLNIESFYQHLKKKKKLWIKTVKSRANYANWILDEDVLLLQQNTEDWFLIHSHNIYHGVINVRERLWLW